MPLISVVLPVYNEEEWIEEAMRSMVAQTETDFEIIAVDDGSTDKTSEILTAFADTDARIKPLRVAHGGIVAALKAGLERAEGRFIARMDADDICKPERLSRQKAFLMANRGVDLVAGRVVFGGDKAKNHGLALFTEWNNRLVTHEDMLLNRFVDTPVIHPSVMFRRECLERFGGYREGPFPEDYELWLRWFDAGARFGKITEPVLVWRDRDQRITRVDHSRCAPSAFHACKAPYLSRSLERNNPHHPRVIVWGAGKASRARVRPLLDHGILIQAWIDVDPRKTGKHLLGAPVLAPDSIPPSGQCFLLAAVGNRGVREEIHAYLETRGFAHGSNFLHLA